MENTKEIEILIIEDSPNDTELILKALSSLNVNNKIYTVKDGEQAIDFIYRTGEFLNREEIPLRVIFLDLKLPKISGLEFLAKIKSDEKFKAIPVVVITVSKDEDDLKKAYELGVNSYIVKPVGAENFTKAVREAGIYWSNINFPPLIEI